MPGFSRVFCFFLKSFLPLVFLLSGDDKCFVLVPAHSSVYVE